MSQFVDIKFSMFFDREKVKRKVKDGTKSSLSKMGAFVRQRAKTSIRPRKKSSVPGQPPSSHAGQLRDRIFFGYDERSESVVIGPTLFKQESPTAPHLLEFSGTTTGPHGEPRRYRKFPFMEPALQKEQDKFPGLFEGSVKD